MNPDELITRREVVSTLFNGEYIQKDDVVSLMEEYAKTKCKEQKEIDANSVGRDQRQFIYDEKLATDG